MTNKDFQYLRKQLKGYEVNCTVTYIITVTTDVGVYNIIKDTGDKYLVECKIPDVGYIGIPYHSTISMAIDHIKGGVF